MTNFSRALMQPWPRTISQRVVPANAGTHRPWPKSEKRPRLQRRNESPRDMGPCVRRDDSLKRHAYENSISDSPGTRPGMTNDGPVRDNLARLSGRADFEDVAIVAGLERDTKLTAAVEFRHHGHHGDHRPAPGVVERSLYACLLAE